MSSRALKTSVALAAAALLVPATASAVTGQMRVLYVHATWGPPTFSHADTERMAAETDAFFQASSSGRFSMPGAVAGPVQLRRSVFDACDPAVLRNELPPSMLAGYERIAFITPIVDSCQFAGLANLTEVLLNGRMFTTLAAHELGHTLALGHASRWACESSRCSVDEYGSRFSVMGGGGGDFNAFEKSRVGWLTGTVNARGNGTHEIGPVEGPTTLPQALVVTTAASQFWFESRGRPTPSFVGDSVQPPGVAVLAGPGAAGDSPSPFPRDNLLVQNPNGGARYGFGQGESFMRPGIFRVTVDRHTPASASLRFQWLDRVAPRRPRIHVERLRRGRVRVFWEPAVERGSGVRTYTLVLNGRARRTVDREFMLVHGGTTFSLARGTHRIGVYARDRAGNRGPASWTRVRIR
jgi:hypothetical protein